MFAMERKTPRRLTDDADGNAANSLHPPPSNILRDEATDDRTENGTKERRDAVQCEGKAPLGGSKYVGKDAARVDDGGTTKSTGEEAQDNKGGNVLAAS
jgi:hypothetical protein